MKACVGNYSENLVSCTRVRVTFNVSCGEETLEDGSSSFQSGTRKCTVSVNPIPGSVGTSMGLPNNRRVPFDYWAIALKFPVVVSSTTFVWERSELHCAIEDFVFN